MRRTITIITLVVFLMTATGLPRAAAEGVLTPAPGAMVGLSPAVQPPMLKGIKVYANDPFRMDFILDKGSGSGVMNPAARLSTDNNPETLIKYFLAALTTPEKDLWVNLSPYEKDRIIPESFGQTGMGRDLLEQDYILKQVTASLLYPEGETGKVFWQKIYAAAYDRYGTTDIPVDTFNKVWIVPSRALIYENTRAGTAYVVESKLKILLESDYMAMSNVPLPSGGHGAPLSDNAERDSVSPSPLPDDQPMKMKVPQVNSLATHPAEITYKDFAKDILREIVIPILEKEVNAGANFAPLRQVENSLILAAWFKARLTKSVLNRVFVDRNRIAGIKIDDPKEAEQIWAKYVEAFKKGAYNLIREERDAFTDEVIPRKYFSGGWNAAQLQLDYTESSPAADPSALAIDATVLSVEFQPLNGGRQAFISQRARPPAALPRNSVHGKMLRGVLRAASDMGYLRLPRGDEIIGFLSGKTVLYVGPEEDVNDNLKEKNLVTYLRDNKLSEAYGLGPKLLSPGKWDRAWFKEGKIEALDAVGTGQGLPLEWQGKFDALVVMSLLDHDYMSVVTEDSAGHELTDAEYRQLYLTIVRGMFKVLSPGGRVLIDTHYVENTFLTGALEEARRLGYGFDVAFLTDNKSQILLTKSDGRVSREGVMAPGHERRSSNAAQAMTSESIKQELRDIAKAAQERFPDSPDVKESLGLLQEALGKLSEEDWRYVLLLAPEIAMNLFLLQGYIDSRNKAMFLDILMLLSGLPKEAKTAFSGLYRQGVLTDEGMQFLGEGLVLMAEDEALTLADHLRKVGRRILARYRDEQHYAGDKGQIELLRAWTRDLYPFRNDLSDLLAHLDQIAMAELSDSERDARFAIRREVARTSGLEDERRFILATGDQRAAWLLGETYSLNDAEGVEFMLPGADGRRSPAAVIRSEGSLFNFMSTLVHEASHMESDAIARQIYKEGGFNKAMFEGFQTFREYAAITRMIDGSGVVPDIARKAIIEEYARIFPVKPGLEPQQNMSPRFQLSKLLVQLGSYQPEYYLVNAILKSLFPERVEPIVDGRTEDYPFNDMFIHGDTAALEGALGKHRFAALKFLVDRAGTEVLSFSNARNRDMFYWIARKILLAPAAGREDIPAQWVERTKRAISALNDALTRKNFMYLSLSRKIGDVPDPRKALEALSKAFLMTLEEKMTEEDFRTVVAGMAKECVLREKQREVALSLIKAALDPGKGGADAAAVTAPGGIDLTRSKEGVEIRGASGNAGDVFNISPEDYQRWDRAQGVVPLIIASKPLVDLAGFLENFP